MESMKWWLCLAFLGILVIGVATYPHYPVASKPQPTPQQIAAKAADEQAIRVAQRGDLVLIRNEGAVVDILVIVEPALGDALQIRSLLPGRGIQPCAVSYLLQIDSAVVSQNSRAYGITLKEFFSRKLFVVPQAIEPAPPIKPSNSPPLRRGLFVK